MIDLKKDDVAAWLSSAVGRKVIAVLKEIRALELEESLDKMVAWGDTDATAMNAVAASVRVRMYDFFINLPDELFIGEE